MTMSVLVTGGTTRLGLAISSLLRERGFEVFTTSHRPDSGADFILDFRRDWRLGRTFGAIVNNAALFTGPDEDLMRVNFLAPKRFINESLAPTVVNILDSRVLAPGFAPKSAYEKSKALLLAETLAPHGAVRVNGVAPGPVIAPVAVSEKAGPLPFGRPSPEAVARAVAFLIEESTISGSVLAVDGGNHLGRRNTNSLRRPEF